MSGGSAGVDGVGRGGLFATADQRYLVQSILGECGRPWGECRRSTWGRCQGERCERPTRHERTTRHERPTRHEAWLCTQLLRMRSRQPGRPPSGLSPGGRCLRVRLHAGRAPRRLPWRGPRRDDLQRAGRRDGQLAVPAWCPSVHRKLPDPLPDTSVRGRALATGGQASGAPTQAGKDGGHGGPRVGRQGRRHRDGDLRNRRRDRVQGCALSARSTSGLAPH